MTTADPLAFVSDHRRWRRLHDDLWTYHIDLAVLGSRIGRRMVAVRIDRRWLVLSPVVPDDTPRRELEEAGSVDALVVPTAFHNRFVRRALAQWPESTAHLTTGARREHLPADRIRDLGRHPPEPWSACLTAIPIDGMPRVNEVVFLHGDSGTLVVSDLCFHITPRHPWWTRTMTQLLGAYPGVGMSRLFRSMIRDRDAFSASLDRILEHDFDRLIMSHGEIVDTNGRDALRRLRERYARR